MYIGIIKYILGLLHLYLSQVIIQVSIMNTFKYHGAIVLFCLMVLTMTAQITYRTQTFAKLIAVSNNADYISLATDDQIFLYKTNKLAFVIKKLVLNSNQPGANPCFTADNILYYYRKVSNGGRGHYLMMGLRVGDYTQLRLDHDYSSNDATLAISCSGESVTFFNSRDDKVKAYKNGKLIHYFDGIGLCYYCNLKSMTYSQYSKKLLIIYESNYYAHLRYYYSQSLFLNHLASNVQNYCKFYDKNADAYICLHKDNLQLQVSQVQNWYSAINTTFNQYIFKTANYDFNFTLSKDYEYLIIFEQIPSDFELFMSRIRVYHKESIFNNPADSEVDLTIYVVGRVLSLDVNEDGSQIVFIREHGNRREMVMVKHNLGQSEIMYPCDDPVYARNYANCELIPNQIITYISFALIILMFIILITLTVILCKKYMQKKREEEQTQQEYRKKDLKEQPSREILPVGN